MGMPVKLSDDLVRVARIEAEAAERSITAQIEHWAKLGRAAESGLSHADVLALKATLDASPAQGTIAPRQSAPERIHAMLMAIARSADRSTVAGALRAGTQPLYESEPEHPDMVVRVEADGRRMPGRFAGRQFKPVRGRRTSRAAKC